MDGYGRKKCVAKILYMYVLGYEPDFGYAEALRLLSSKKFSEKQMVRIQGRFLLDFQTGAPKTQNGFWVVKF